MGKGEKKNESPHNGGFKELLRRTNELQQLEATAKQLVTERQDFLEQLKQVNEQLIISSLRLREEAEQLAQQYNKLLTIVTIMADEVYFCDTQGCISMLNDAAARGFGLRSVSEAQQMPAIKELLSKLETFNLDGNPRRCEDAPLLRSLRGETIRGAEEIVRHPKTGKLRHRIVNSAPVLDPEGQIVGAVAVARDIGEFNAPQSDERTS